MSLVASVNSLISASLSKVQPKAVAAGSEAGSAGSRFAAIIDDAASTEASDLPTANATSRMHVRAADALLAKGISDPDLLVKAYLQDAAMAYRSDGLV